MEDSLNPVSPEVLASLERPMGAEAGQRRSWTRYAAGPCDASRGNPDRKSVGGDACSHPGEEAEEGL